jgi:quinohemoprotein ethanol dehydrogenase
MSDTGMELSAWHSPDWKADVPGEGFGVRIVSTMTSREDGVKGSLQAWDPVKRRQVWEAPLPGYWNPGTMTTAGNLVFQGRADGAFVAYDAGTGAELWRHDLGLGISAPPITYVVNGRQYVALLVGWGAVASGVGGPAAASHGWAYGVHRRRLVAFSLRGTTTLPAQPAPVVAMPIPSTDFPIDASAAARGASVFVTRCRWCHGTDALAAGMTPDLRASGVALSQRAFAEVVRDGSRRSRGMPRFAEFTDQRLEDLRHYIRQQADLALTATRR